MGERERERERDSLGGREVGMVELSRVNARGLSKQQPNMCASVYYLYLLLVQVFTVCT